MLADMVLEDIALGGEPYDGETGSSLSAGMGACIPIEVFRVGSWWTLDVCIGAEIAWA